MTAPTVRSESISNLIRDAGREIEALKAQLASAARQLESGVDPLQVAQQLRGGLRAEG
jgi:hypothetical protein